MQSRVVSRGGSPCVPLDAVMIAATNSANLVRAQANQEALAQINRMQLIPFEWAINPGEIAKILLYTTGLPMRMLKLEGASDVVADGEELVDERTYKPIDIDQIFPDPVLGEPIKTSDRRFKLIYGGEDEDSGVFIVPRTLMFWADLWH